MRPVAVLARTVDVRVTAHSWPLVSILARDRHTERDAALTLRRVHRRGARIQRDVEHFAGRFALHLHVDRAGTADREAEFLPRGVMAAEVERARRGLSFRGRTGPHRPDQHARGDPHGVAGGEQRRRHQGAPVLFTAWQEKHTG